MEKLNFAAEFLINIFWKRFALFVFYWEKNSLNLVFYQLKTPKILSLTRYRLKLLYDVMSEMGAFMRLEMSLFSSKWYQILGKKIFSKHPVEKLYLGEPGWKIFFHNKRIEKKNIVFFRSRRRSAKIIWKSNKSLKIIS